MQHNISAMHKQKHSRRRRNKPAALSAKAELFHLTRPCMHFLSLLARTVDTGALETNFAVVTIGIDSVRLGQMIHESHGYSRPLNVLKQEAAQLFDRVDRELWGHLGAKSFAYDVATLEQSADGQGRLNLVIKKPAALSLQKLRDIVHYSAFGVNGELFL